MLTELTDILKGWLRWLRLRRASSWALRGLAIGLACSLAVSMIALAQAWLLRDEFLALVGLLSLGSMCLAAIVAFAWPVDHLAAARTFDLAFHLKERVSTALELSHDGASSNAEIVRRQLEDAIVAARRVQHRQALPMRLKILEGLIALLLALSIGLLWFSGEDWFRAATQARAVEAAVAEQASAIEDMLAQVEENPTFSPEQVQALSRPLQEALQGLSDDPSLEGSVSVLVSSGEALQALADPQAQAMVGAMQVAGEQLAAQQGSPLQSMGEKLSSGDTLGAATELAQLDPGGLSQAEAQALASQLQEMAEALASINPELATKLQEAAQALQDGDTAAAQAALDQAASSLADAGGQVQFSQMAQQLAEQVQAGAGEVLAAGGGDQASLGGAQPGSGSDGAGSGGSGSGTGESAGGSPQAGSEAGNEPIPQNNLPGDGGERPYEGIYAPELLGGDGGPLVGLPGAGEEGTLVGEGPSTPSESGVSLVPYDQVLPFYEPFNRRAIEQGEIPVQFIHIIRNYFDSLEP